MFERAKMEPIFHILLLLLFQQLIYLKGRETGTKEEKEERSSVFRLAHSLSGHSSQGLSELKPGAQKSI